MTALLVGCLAFLLAALSDTAKLHGSGSGSAGALLFAAGGLMLSCSTLSLLLNAKPLRLLSAAPLLKSVELLLCLAALALLLYTLFFALPLSASYGTGGEHPLVNHGVYALCRHPGVLWLAMFYLLFWIFCGTLTSFLAFVLFSSLDILYVLWQDRVVFPRSIAGYAAYQITTPFLIPNAASLRASFKK